MNCYNKLLTEATWCTSCYPPSYHQLHHSLLSLPLAASFHPVLLRCQRIIYADWSIRGTDGNQVSQYKKEKEKRDGGMIEDEESLLLIYLISSQPHFSLPYLSSLNFTSCYFTSPHLSSHLFISLELYGRRFMRTSMDYYKMLSCNATGSNRYERSYFSL